MALLCYEVDNITVHFGKRIFIQLYQQTEVKGQRGYSIVEYIYAHCLAHTVLPEQSRA